MFGAYALSRGGVVRSLSSNSVCISLPYNMTINVKNYIVVYNVVYICSGWHI